MGIVNERQVAQDKMDGAEQLGRRLSFLDSEPQEEQE
jgi:bacterioferritin (cytochrome b1)